MNRLLKLGFCLVLLAPLAAAAQNVERYTLSNGLTVVLNEDHTMPQVFGAVAVKVGAKNDPADATGLAHYQEHMLFKGTTTLGTNDWESEKPFIDSIFLMYDKLGQTKEEDARTKIQQTINRLSVSANEFAIPNEFDNLIKSMGGTGLNAFTAEDMTVYFNAFPGNQMERWLELYAHRFRKPVFRSFQAELEVVYEEKNMRSDNFFLQIYQEMHKQMFSQHPYGTQTAIGTVEHLKNPSLTKMYEFFKTYYVANNMVLVISGDFQPEETKKYIKQSWGTLPTGKIPEFPEYPETIFDGQKLVEAKMSPIKLGVLGFSTVPKGHQDEVKLELLHAMLNNSSQSGLLDKLALDKKIMGAGVIPLNYGERGATMMFFIPKIVGQKHEEAEALVLAEINKLKEGDFEDWVLEAAKQQMYIQSQKALESNENVVLALIDAEIFGEGPASIFNKSERINSISKQDIIAIAKKYYGDNHLSFYSSTGFPKKDKIEKPGFEPVISKNENQSEFAKKLLDIKPSKANIKFIDFNKDITQHPFNGSSHLYHTLNPKNDIFSLNIKYWVGNETMPMLSHVSSMMDYAGADNLKVKELKDLFNKMGASYGFFDDKDYFTLHVEGLEANLEEILENINKILTKPTLEQDNMEVLVDGAKSDRKVEKSQPEELANALFAYLRYGEKSQYLSRLTMKELKKLEATEILKAFKEAQTYKCEIHYVGQKPIEEVEGLLTDRITWAENPKMGLVPFYKPVKKYDENTVFFVNKKSARQSKVYFMTNSFAYRPNFVAKVDAFNMYFGGGFSGLVVQEIREYRSLAYNAGAFLVLPASHEFPVEFYGVLGTQADKTLDAVRVFHELVREMPNKPERMTMIREFLINQAQTDQPGFRSMSSYIVSLQNKGYTEDPRRELIERYQHLDFEDVLVFYEKYLKTNTLVIAIAGDKRAIDVKALKEFGTVKVLKAKNLFSK